MFIDLPKKTIDESEGIDILSASFKDSNNNILKSLRSGENVYLSLICKAHKTFNHICLHIRVTEFSGGGGTVLFLSSIHDNQLFQMSPGTHEIKLEMPFLGLTPGLYTMNIKLKEGAIATLDYVESFKFTVNPDSTMSECKFYQQRKWHLVSNIR